MSVDKKPLISVITVCFNAEEFIEETIQSVAGQLYDAIEFIIVDGGSTDNTVKIIRRSNKHITTWISEPDEGISDAFNKGYALSTGDYILYLNSDDMLHDTGVIAEMVSRIEECGYPKVIYGDCNVLDRESGEVRYLASIEYQPVAFLKGKTIPHPSLLLHRSYFVQYGLFDKEFQIAMDYELFLRGLLKEKVVHVPCLMTDVRDGGVSTSHRVLAVDETIKALVKNHYVKPGFGVSRLKLMYSARGVARRVIDFFKGGRA